MMLVYCSWPVNGPCMPARMVRAASKRPEYTIYAKYILYTYMGQRGRNSLCAGVLLHLKIKYEQWIYKPEFILRMNPFLVVMKFQVIGQIMSMFAGSVTQGRCTSELHHSHKKLLH